MRLVKRFSFVTLAAIIPLAACGEGGEDPAVCTEPTGPHYAYVVSGIQVPTNPAEANQIGLDIDGVEESVTTDNALGTALATLAGQADLDIATAVGDAINSGEVIILMDVQSEDLTNSTCSGVSVYLGDNPSVSPCDGETDEVCGRHLDGTASFEISANSPTDTSLNGTIIGGNFKLGPDDPPGNFTLELDLIEGGAPLTLDLVGARVEIGTVAEDGLTGGLLGGAVTKNDLETSILPAVETLVDEQVAVDCQGTAPECCTAGSPGALIVDLFDTDDDCDITLQEITESDLVATVLRPDLDLFDADGGFSPNSDGEKDSLSLGLGFTAVSGTFTPPAQ